MIFFFFPHDTMYSSLSLHCDETRQREWWVPVCSMTFLRTINCGGPEPKKKKKKKNILLSFLTRLTYENDIVVHEREKTGLGLHNG